MKIEVKNPQQVVKEAFWLAWQACSGPVGPGLLQNRPAATKEDVWECAFNKEDYPGGNTLDHEEFANRPGRVYADYVFGRMMKLGLEWDDTSVTISDRPTDREYQSWARKYFSCEDLVREAIKNVEK